MRATENDRIIIRGKTDSTPDRHGTVREVRGQDGEPPYLVTFDDGHESLVFPGSDFIIERVH
ncbi:DUF1918 domain-containing protein [Cryobacterium sp. AP23]|jgi:hypothetical protein